MQEKIHCYAKWSGQRGSNPRHQAWEACTLPAELCPLMFNYGGFWRFVNTFLLDFQHDVLCIFERKGVLPYAPTVLLA